MSKWFWIALALVVAALVGVFAYNNSKEQAAVNNAGDPTVITASDHTEGPADAKVTLLEYGDFQCPACATTYTVVKQARSAFGDKVRFVFRHFPLVNIHPNAMAASRAAEAAGLQGKFFEMHDILYEKQDEWSSSTKANELFRDYAKQLGLDVSKFNSDLNSAAVNDAVNNDLALGKKQNVDGTPSFFLNGQKLESIPKNFEEFKSKLDEALAKAQ